MNNVNRRKTDSHQNLLSLILERVLVLRRDENTEQIVYHGPKWSISHRKSLLIMEMIHLNFADAAWNTIQIFELFDFYWVHAERIYRVTSLCQFFWDFPILLNVNSHYPRHFSKILTSVSTCVFICWLTVADKCPLPLWSWSLVSPKPNFRKQRHSVQSEVNTSSQNGVRQWYILSYI